MKKSFLFHILFLLSLNLFAQKTYVFLGSYNHDKTQEGIYVYQLNTKSGKLKRITSLKGILNPSFLTISPNGKYVFACTESKTPNAGSVSSFEFNPENHSLTYINSQKSGGENPVYVAAHKNGNWLVNGNYTEGSISVYPIAENGFIKPFVQNFQFADGSINKERQNRAHMHSTVFSPNFDYLLCPDLGADKIRIFEFNQQKEQPVSNETFFKTSLGSGPRHLTFHPNGKWVYCINEMAGTINAFAFDNGKLDSLQVINTHPDELKDHFESSDIHFSPDGRFLYASNRGNENNITIFEILNDGKLKSKAYQSTLGKHPRTFAIDESGNFLIVTNVVSNNVVVFKRNSETGLLKKVGKKLKIRNVSCVQIRRYP